MEKIITFAHKKKKACITFWALRGTVKLHRHLWCIFFTGQTAAIQFNLRKIRLLWLIVGSVIIVLQLLQLASCNLLLATDINRSAFQCFLSCNLPIIFDSFVNGRQNSVS